MHGFSVHLMNKNKIKVKIRISTLLQNIFFVSKVIFSLISKMLLFIKKSENGLQLATLKQIYPKCS